MSRFHFEADDTAGYYVGSDMSLYLRHSNSGRLTSSNIRNRKPSLQIQLQIWLLPTEFCTSVLKAEGEEIEEGDGAYRFNYTDVK